MDPKSHPELPAETLLDTLPPRAGKRNPGLRVGGSRAPHPSTWRKASFGRELPLHHPPSLSTGPAKPQSWQSRLPDGGRTPNISLSSPSAIAPIFLPPILGCCKGLASGAANRARRPGTAPEAAEVRKGSVHLHTKTSPSAGPSFRALARPREGSRGPRARRTRACASPSPGSLQTQLFRSPGTAGSKATRTASHGGGGQEKAGRGRGFPGLRPWSDPGD